MNYKTEIAEFVAEFTESFLYSFKGTEFFTYESMVESLYKELDMQLKSMRESTLIQLVKSYSFDDAFQLVDVTQLKNGHSIYFLAKAIYMEQIDPKIMWEKMNSVVE
jgi:hypothetical protein